jgi:hypothetical protein
LPDALADARRPRRRRSNGASPSVHSPIGRSNLRVAAYQMNANPLEARAAYTKPPSPDGIERLY